jgi:hypothetical protein
VTYEHEIQIFMIEISSFNTFQISHSIFLFQIFMIQKSILDQHESISAWEWSENLERVWDTTCCFLSQKWDLSVVCKKWSKENCLTFILLAHVCSDSKTYIERNSSDEMKKRQACFVKVNFMKKFDIFLSLDQFMTRQPDRSSRSSFIWLLYYLISLLFEFIFFLFFFFFSFQFLSH